jgi:hypothetical protein
MGYTSFLPPLFHSEFLSIGLLIDFLERMVGAVEPIAPSKDEEKNLLFSRMVFVK